MLRPRIIPCLLVHNGGLVKTRGFAEPKYVGDPLNAVRIFNEKEVDELIVADIDATVRNSEPDYDLIANLAAECRMPLCYAGGVKTVSQFETIVGLGVEKVAIGSAAIRNPELISGAAETVGRQSVVVVLDIRKTGLLRRYEVVTENGRWRSGMNPVDVAIDAEKRGAGEILLNSVDQDGMMTGFDFKLADEVRSQISIPMSILGGAGSLSDIEKAIARYGIVGAAAGSLFVFKGKYRAVLIQYPNHSEKESIFKAAEQQHGRVSE